MVIAKAEYFFEFHNHSTNYSIFQSTSFSSVQFS